MRNALYGISLIFDLFSSYTGLPQRKPRHTYVDTQQPKNKQLQPYIHNSHRYPHRPQETQMGDKWIKKQRQIWRKLHI